MELEIKDQPAMGFRRLLELTLTAIRYRLFRSTMTVLVITVAIAFLVNIVVGSFIQKALEEKVSRRIAETRLALTWAARLEREPTLSQLVAELGASDADATPAREALRFGDLPASELPAFLDGIRLAKVFLDFFRSLPFDTRTALVGKRKGMAILESWTHPEELARFRAARAEAISVRFPDEFERLDSFIARWPANRAILERIRANRTLALGQVARAPTSGSRLGDLRELDGAFGRAVREAGFSLPPDDVPEIVRQAKEIALASAVLGSLSQVTMKKALAGKLNIQMERITDEGLWKFLGEEDNVRWYLAALEERTGTRPDWEVGKVVRAAAAQEEDTYLAGLARQSMKVEGGLFGLGQRLTWLVIVSLLVCVVGIANAMLMSVTERYTEIATMKCLGALDGSILWIFVLEASLLGTVGAAIGAAIGTLLGIGRTVLGMGGMAATTIPWGDVVLVNGVAVVLGTLLAALAAVFPSLKAARLAPMEAMRIE